MRTRILIYLLIIAGWYVFISNILLPIFYGYDFFIGYAAALINKKQRIGSIREHLSIGNFNIIRIAICVATIILMACTGYIFLKVDKVRNVLLRYFSVFQRALNVWKRNWQQSSNVSKAIFSLAIVYLVVQSVLLMGKLLYLHDETYTVHSFILPGPIVAATFYPYPNNHIFFSIVSWPFKYLPLPPAYAFRLPSLMAIILTCFVLYMLIKKTANDLIASLLVFIFVLMLPVMLFAAQARGYSFIFLFFSLVLYCAIEFVQTNKMVYNKLFCLFSILGFYTLPSFMYPFAVVIIASSLQLLFAKKTHALLQFIKYNVIAGMVILLLYLPIIFTSGGWAGFLKVIYVGYDESHTNSINNLENFYLGIYPYQFFEKRIVAGAFFVVLIIWAIQMSLSKLKGMSDYQRSILFYGTVGLLMPFISFMVQHKMQPERIHSYMAICLVLLCALMLSSIKGAMVKNLIAVLTLVLVCCLNISYAWKSKMVNNESNSSKIAWDLTNKVFENRSNGIDTCYSFDLYYTNTLQMKWALNKRDIVIYQIEANSPSSKIFDLNDHYPWIISTHNHPIQDSVRLHAAYTPILVRKEAVLWKRK